MQSSAALPHKCQNTIYGSIFLSSDFIFLLNNQRNVVVYMEQHMPDVMYELCSLTGVCRPDFIHVKPTPKFHPGLERIRHNWATLVWKLEVLDSSTTTVDCVITHGFPVHASELETRAAHLKLVLKLFTIIVFTKCIHNPAKIYLPDANWTHNLTKFLDIS